MCANFWVHLGWLLCIHLHTGVSSNRLQHVEHKPLGPFRLPHPSASSGPTCSWFCMLPKRVRVYSWLQDVMTVALHCNAVQHCGRMSSCHKTVATTAVLQQHCAGTMLCCASIRRFHEALLLPHSCCSGNSAGVSPPHGRGAWVSALA